LSHDPIESSIEIKVNGYVSTDWLYNELANSITMTSPPPEGSSIDITYAVWAECEE
jgi:hypothetical protein